MDTIFTDFLVGKEPGCKMTLPQLLQDHSEMLSAKFNKLSKEEKEASRMAFLEAREEQETVPKRLSNVAVSKAVNAKL